MPQPIILGEMGKDPASVVYEGYKEALSNDSDLLIIDTAGRLHTQKGLMDELAKIKRIIQKIHRQLVHFGGFHYQ